MAQLAASPHWIMNEINTTVVGIHHSNYEQIWAHKHVSNSQICDQERVHLAKEKMSVESIQQTKTNSLTVTQMYSYPHWILIFTGLYITYKTVGTSNFGKNSVAFKHMFMSSVQKEHKLMHKEVVMCVCQYVHLIFRTTQCTCVTFYIRRQRLTVLPLL